jgi:hypothetical protein
MEPTLTQRITRIVAAFHAASFRQLALSTGASEAEVSDVCYRLEKGPGVVRIAAPDVAVWCGFRTQEVAECRNRL